MFNIQEILKATRGRLLQDTSNKKIEGISIDSRTINQGEVFIALKGVNFDGHNFIREAISKGAGCAIASNKELINNILVEFKRDNLRFPMIYVKDTLNALTDLACFNRRRFSVPVIAITGTNGKTTTKDMTADILSSEYNVLKNTGTQNNKIGVSLNLLKLNNNHDIAVFELGTNHLGEIEELAKIVSANIGVITNIGPGHLEFFSSIRSVFKEKFSLLKKLNIPEVGIINMDDPYLSNISNRKTFGFGIKNKADVRAGNISFENTKLSFRVNKKHKFFLNSPALHNIYNSLAAIASGLLFGIEINKSSQILAEFKFPTARMSVLNIDDITVLDDTYNSNPVSLREAIDTLTRYNTTSRRILVMADMLELGENSIPLHRGIGRFVAKSNIDYFITLGKFSRYAALAAKELCKDTKKIIICDSHKQVNDILLDTIEKGDVILVKGSRAMQMEKIIENLELIQTQ